MLSDPLEVKDLAHDREEVDVLYKAAIKVKPVISALEKTVENLEQKKRMHDMSAKIVLDLEAMETQQRQIVGSMKENKELIEYVKRGMQENVETIR